MAFSLKLTSIALTLSVAFTTLTSQASQNDSYGSWAWHANAVTISLDSEAAASQGVEDSAYSIGASASYLADGWVTSLGLDVIIYDDNETFTQTVIGDGAFNDGDRSVESSDATAGLFSVSTGYQWEFGEDNDFAVQAQGGFSFIVFSERSIAYCSDCYSEDIDLDGGAFVRASLVKSTSSVSFGVFAQQYVSGDIDNAFGIFIGSSF